MKKLNVMSLFDGINCGRLALKIAKIEVENYFSSEIDPYAIQITQNNFPDTIQLGDVNNINFNDFVGKIDLLIGGSPCQDLSISGNREGLSGARSGLFFKYVEALNVIKPRYFLLENNFAMPHDAFVKISELVGVYPVLINSALVSRQTRNRYYWTNIGPLSYNLFGFPTSAIPQPEDKKIKIKDILEDFVDEKYNISAQKQARFVPKASENILGTVKTSENTIGQRNVVYNPEGKIGALLATDYKQPKMILLGYIEKNTQSSRVYDINFKTPTLNANGGGMGAKTGLYKINGKIRKLTPVECERCQNLPDNYTAGISDTQRYKCIGNGWTVNVIAHIFSFLKEGFDEN